MEKTVVLDQSNAKFVNYDTSKIFLNNTFTQTADVYFTSAFRAANEGEKLKAGTLLYGAKKSDASPDNHELAVTPNVDLSEGFMIPVGVLTAPVTVPASGDSDPVDGSVCIKGEVAEEKLSAADYSDLNDVMDSKLDLDDGAHNLLNFTVRQAFMAFTQLVFVEGTELTEFDNS